MPAAVKVTERNYLLYLEYLQKVNWPLVKCYIDTYK